MRRGAWIGLGIVAFLALLSILAPLSGLFNPEAISPDKVFAGPSVGHPLGYDSTGRDVLSG